MTVCNGAGDGGDHCCYINGQVCEFYAAGGRDGGCTVWDSMNKRRWQRAPIGQWFAERYPGYTCQDWPQNIPAVLAAVESGSARPSSVCCWSVNYAST